tara:strand:+ start:1336 stop:1602 length:267 start_codon:yes stop_codon:yes gene_type:complete
MRLRNKHDRYKIDEKDEYSASIDGPGVEIERENKYPTQEEIIKYNRKHCKDYLTLSNYTEEMVLVEKNLLEKLKDFDYWKEWRNKKEG